MELDNMIYKYVLFYLCEDGKIRYIVDPHWNDMKEFDGPEDASKALLFDTLEEAEKIKCGQCINGCMIRVITMNYSSGPDF